MKDAKEEQKAMFNQVIDGYKQQSQQLQQQLQQSNEREQQTRTDMSKMQDTLNQLQIQVNQANNRGCDDDDDGFCVII